MFVADVPRGFEVDAPVASDASVIRSGALLRIYAKTGWLLLPAATAKGTLMHAALVALDLESGLPILLILVLVLFGGSQLPKLARGLGSAQKEFKKGLEEGADDDKPAAKPTSD